MVGWLAGCLSGWLSIRSSRAGGKNSVDCRIKGRVVTAVQVVEDQEW